MQPWEEDTWAEIVVVAGKSFKECTRGVRFVGVKRCSRCTVTTRDQESGRSSDGGLISNEGEEENSDPFLLEPLATLSLFRASKRGAKEGGVYFGMNLVMRGDYVGRQLEVGHRVLVERVDPCIGPL